MGIVFLALALGLFLLARKIDRHDRMMRGWLFAAAGLNAVAFVVMLGKGDPLLWSLLPAERMSWW